MTEIELQQYVDAVQKAHDMVKERIEFLKQYVNHIRPDEKIDQLLAVVYANSLESVFEFLNLKHLNKEETDSIQILEQIIKSFEVQLDYFKKLEEGAVTND